ncbi:hypothetical protein [Faecalispora anaeroviscerum]|uniref:hypothetical protein n=1 Tax=Faecalispora anaeroviscerum TaxID=2991836 RepID=UPI0024BAC880|nr:hypothetical protein [Faecalispora anaeroviscerum]
MNIILAPKSYVDAQTFNKFSVYGFNSDTGSAPEQVSDANGIPAASFKADEDRELLMETDWAQRADIPVSLEYYMDSEQSAQKISLQLAYSFDGAAFVWMNAETIDAPSDKLIHTMAFANPIPVSAIPSGDGHTLRIKIRRVGSSELDTHSANFCLTAVKYYRAV